MADKQSRQAEPGGASEAKQAFEALEVRRDAMLQWEARLTDARDAYKAAEAELSQARNDYRRAREALLAVCPEVPR